MSIKVDFSPDASNPQWWTYFRLEWSLEVWRLGRYGAKNSVASSAIKRTDGSKSCEYFRDNGLFVNGRETNYFRPFNPIPEAKMDFPVGFCIIIIVLFIYPTNNIPWYPPETFQLFFTKVPPSFNIIFFGLFLVGYCYRFVSREI